jgi:hypothetical protein
MEKVTTLDELFQDPYENEPIEEPIEAPVIPRPKSLLKILLLKLDKLTTNICSKISF